MLPVRLRHPRSRCAGFCLCERAQPRMRFPDQDTEGPRMPARSSGRPTFASPDQKPTEHRVLSVIELRKRSQDSMFESTTNSTEDHQPSFLFPSRSRVRPRLVLQRPPRAGARCPCPLEIETAQVSGHIHYFSDEEQAGNFSALHCFRRQFVGVHASRCHLGLFVALGSRRSTAQLCMVRSSC